MTYCIDSYTTGLVELKSYLTQLGNYVFHYRFISSQFWKKAGKMHCKAAKQGKLAFIFEKMPFLNKYSISSVISFFMQNAVKT